MTRCVLVGVLAVACGVARADDADDPAVELAEKLGGTVKRDDTAEGKPVVAVSLLGTKVGDAGAKEPVVYRLCEPTTRYDRVMTRADWMPVLIGEVI